MTRWPRFVTRFDMAADTSSSAVPPPDRRLHIGVTGHRFDHPGFESHANRIAATLGAILDLIDGAIRDLPVPAGAGPLAPTRLHSLLADGTDVIVAEMALARGYDLVAPLPFGRRLNKTINAKPRDAADVRALLAGGEAQDPLTQRHADAIRGVSDRARLFCLADQDTAMTDLLLARFDHPGDGAKAQRLTAEVSRRVALAGRIVIEQSDIVIGVWDGVSTAHVGGTGHTIAAALQYGAPVIWIDTRAPDRWRILIGPEALLGHRDGDGGGGDGGSVDREAEVQHLVQTFLVADGKSGHPGLATLTRERWRPRSSRIAHAYRRIEALFGGRSDRSRLRGLTEYYPLPGDSGAIAADPMVAAVRDLPDAGAPLATAISEQVTRRFRWIDGISSRLSDAYRGGMMINFILSSLAIVGGIAYLPLVAPTAKWGFAVFELLLLCIILAITFSGQRRRWHARWFETRRAAEYLRHGAILLALGSARATGRWPKGAETDWPEFYARQALRGVGLPQLAITPAYLRGVLDLLDRHVVAQRDYHFDKARRLTNVHHNLDRLSERLFQCAVASVALYLMLVAAAALRIIPGETVAHVAKLFTLLGVLFPTFGAGIAGIRYFGDFERFASISEMTGEKLDVIHARIARLANVPGPALDYGSVAELVHAADDVVFAEIENWQAVFGSKQVTVPV